MPPPPPPPLPPPHVLVNTNELASALLHIQKVAHGSETVGDTWPDVVTVALRYFFTQVGQRMQDDDRNDVNIHGPICFQLSETLVAIIAWGPWQWRQPQHLKELQDYVKHMWHVATRLIAKYVFGTETDGLVYWHSCLNHHAIFGGLLCKFVLKGLLTTGFAQGINPLEISYQPQGRMASTRYKTVTPAKRQAEASLRYNLSTPR